MSDSSDDEYAPIDIASWGSQAPSQSNNPAEEDTSKDWDSLLDSKIKVGANGIGSGQLHRKGTNFKPVGEDLILAQRLNKPVGKTQMQSAVREVELSLGLPPSKEKSPRNKKKPQMDNGTRKFSHKTSHSSTTNNNHRKQNSHFEVPSTIRVPSRTNSNDGGGSNWLQTSLVDTPFWTEKKDMPPTPVTSPPAQPKIPTTYTRPSTAAATNGRSNISSKPKVENVWTKNVDNVEEKDSWGAVTRDMEVLASTGWDSDTTKPEIPSSNTVKGNQQSNTKLWSEPKTTTPANTTASEWISSESDWAASATNLGWGEAPKSSGGWGEPTVTDNNNHTNHNTIPSTEPSWINSITSEDSYSSQPPLSNSSSRFSNPSKQRYSSTIPMNVPKPLNYRPQSSQPTQLATAPPPPPENNLLITIQVELSDTIKIAVDVHELDDPSKLAQNFANNNNIKHEKVIFALTDLFSKQKSQALKKRQQKLQRRVPNNNYQQPQSQSKYYQKDNVYTNSSYQQSSYQQSSYQQSSYQQPSLLPSPPPFVRRVYY